MSASSGSNAKCYQSSDAAQIDANENLVQLSNIGKCSNESENSMQKSDVRQLNVDSNSKKSACESLQQNSNNNIDPCENFMQNSNVRKLNIVSNVMMSDACESLMQTPNVERFNAVSDKVSENLIQVTNVGQYNSNINSNIVPIEDHSLQAAHVVSSQIPSVIYNENLPIIHSEEVLTKSIQDNTSSTMNSNDFNKYGNSNSVLDEANMINKSLSQARHLSSQISPVIYASNLENKICMPPAVSNIVKKSLQASRFDSQASVDSSILTEELNNNNDSEICKISQSSKIKTDNIDAMKIWPLSNYSIPKASLIDAKMVNTPLLQMHVANQISPVIFSPVSNLETEQRKIFVQACDGINNVMPICNTVNSPLLQTGNIVCPISPVLYGGNVASNDPRKVFIQGSQPFGMMQMKNYSNVENSRQIQPAYYVLVDNNQNIIKK